MHTYIRRATLKFNFKSHGTILWGAVFFCEPDHCACVSCRVYTAQKSRGSQSPLSQKSVRCRALLLLFRGEKRHQKVISMPAAVPDGNKNSPKFTKKTLIAKNEWNIYASMQESFQFAIFRNLANLAYPLMAATYAVRSGISLGAHCSSYSGGIKAFLLLCMIIQRRRRQRQILFFQWRWENLWHWSCVHT